MVEIGSSTSPVSREQYAQQIAALRQERTKLDASARRWDIATKVDTAVAVVALAPLTLLTGCPTQTTPSQPPYVPPVPEDNGEGEPVVPSEGEPEGEPVVPSEGEPEGETGPVNGDKGFAVKTFKMTVEEGNRDANDTDPGGNVGPINVGGTGGGITALGYTNRYWTVKNFVGETNYHDVQVANIRPEDISDIAFGLQGVNDTPVQPADVTGKSVAIINVDSTTVLYPGDYITFPNILVKGSEINQATGANLAQYLTTSAPFVDSNGNNVHDELEMFYQTGLSIAFRRSAPDMQMMLYTYANGDPLTATPGGTGRVLDPRTSTASHYSWSNDQNGVPNMMFGNRYPNETSPVMFNPYPMIDLSETPEAKQAFVSGTTGASLPEEVAGFGYTVDGYAEADIPADGRIYYNTDRNNGASDNANGMPIVGRSNAGLLYVSPSEVSRLLNGTAHTAIQVKFPAEGVGIPQEVIDNGGSMAVRFTTVEDEVNTGVVKTNPAY